MEQPNQTKRFLRRVLFSILTVVFSVAVGVFSMAGAYKIPIDTIQKNIGKDSLKYYYMTKDEILNISLFGISRLDVFTDMLMFKNCSEGNINGSATNQAINFWDTKYNDEDETGRDNIQDIIKDDKLYEIFDDWVIVEEKALLLYPLAKAGAIKDTEICDNILALGNELEPYITTYSYGRYWHGYLAILKPLLYFLSPSGIYTLNAVLQFLLIALIGIIIARKHKKALIPFAAFIMCINPVGTASCIQYSSVMYITLIDLLIFFIFEKELKEKSCYWVIFLLTGVLTNFFDFLTFPIVSLGVPLVFYIYLNKESIKETIYCVIFWGIGYAGMWAGKWALIAIFHPENFKSIVDAAILRSSSQKSMFAYITVDKITYLDVIKENLIYAGVLVLGYILSIVAIYILFCIHKKQLTKEKITQYFITCLLPFVWMAVLKNHSYAHAYFVSHILSIIPTAILAYFASMGKPIKKQKKEECYFEKDFHSGRNGV